MTGTSETANGKPGSSSKDSGIVERVGEDAFQVRALSRGLRILALFTAENPEWSLSELSRRTGLHKATTYRMTRTMEAEGFLVFDATMGKYHLGPATIPLSFLASSQSELLRTARPYLQELAELTGETSNLAVRVAGSVVIIGQVLTSHPFKPSLPLGRVLNDLANAHGKVFAAFQSAADEAHLLSVPQARLTPNTVTDPAELAAQLAQVRTEGVAFDVEEHGLGVCSVAAPVRDQSGDVRATLSVVAPRERFGLQDRKKHAQAVKGVAASFSAHLGYESA
jgi:DNA-binding IclR family transcriptional regulator